MIMMKRILLAFFVLSMALSATAQRVYINPGHGDWGSDSRPMATVNYAAYDTLGFFESNTNLWKAFALQEKLVAAGYDVMMSRTENGPYPYVYGDESIDKKLLEICAEVTYYDADYFISIHSNANVDGDLFNYPLFLYAGTDGDGEKNHNSRSMADAAWPKHFEAFGNDLDNTNIDHGFEPNSHYSRNEPNLRGDESFYNDDDALDVLNHSCPGYLVEGYFHTYQPARHRALNPDWCRQEGIRYFRGIQDYFKFKPEEQVGYIMGCVRDISVWFSHAYYTPMQSSYDPFKPINGAKVVLRDASGNIIRTECYRHVARHKTDQYYYTTDNNYNGIFVFENLDPGKYTLTVHADEYKDTSMIVDVTANATVYPEIFLTLGQGTEPQIDVDVIWVLNGGKVDGTLPSKIEGSAYTLPTPTRAGYRFQGWFDNEDGTGTALETLPVDYKGTVYAIWERTSVTWQLNGGVVYPDNQWLWDDFQKTKLVRTELVSVADAWEYVIEDVGGKAIYGYLSEREYIWLREYLWPIIQSLDLGDEGYKRWGVALDAFLNCTAYTYNAQTIDFTEAGKPSMWRAYAQEQGADSRFYTPITLPDQITYKYTIPTPEKEGFEFVGWYDNPNGEGEKRTTLPEGYNSTVYAIWKNVPLNKVVWVLNDGHVYPSNDWLWQDFCNVFNGIHSRDLNNPLDENAFLEIWNDPSNNVSGKQAYYMLIRDLCSTDRYFWLGDYLWKKTETAAGGNSSYINLSNEWWGKVIWAFFNCTTYTYTTIDKNTSDEKTITIDFSVAGQPKSWREYADTHKNDPEREEISPDFYTDITLPEIITTTDYIIPTPEKEGYTFQGWYNNPSGIGDPITVLQKDYAGIIYAIWQAPVPCIVAYDLNCNYLIGKMAFEFSFYANTQPTAGKLIFYNMNKEPIGNMNEEPEPIGEYTIDNLRQGKNTVVINAEDIPALNQALIEGRDFLWEVHLEAPPSTLFAEIFRSEPFNTAYATIDNSPESDFFGSIWVANQQKHGYSNGETDGGIWRLVPEQGYARDGGAFAGGHRPHRPRPDDPKPNGSGGQLPRWDGQQPPQGGGGQPQGGGGQPQPNGGQPQPNGGQPQPNGSGQQPPQGGKQEPPRGGRPDHTPSENTETGFEVIFRPTVAPDGTVYLTDNGKSYGGVFVMDPHTKQITNFFDGCTYANGEWKYNSNLVGSGSTGAHIYWYEDGDNKNGFNPITSKLFLMHNTHLANNNEDNNGETRGFFVYDLMGNTPSPQYTNLKHLPNEKDGLADYVNTGVTDFAIVGTSRGAWVCQLRKEDKNVISDPSLTFYPSDNSTPTIFTRSLDTSVGGIFGDNELIHGSFGSAIAVNKTENLLAMVGGTGNIMLFDIKWSNETTPTLTNKRDYSIVADDSNTTGEWDIPTITTLNFDYAGNLVATLGETYNDASDQHQVVIFTLPKTPNYIDVPSRYSQRVPSLVEDDQCASIAEVNTPYETVEIHRKMQKGMYNTICLPFGINSLEGTLYEGASVMKFVGTAIEKVGGEEVLKLNFSPVEFMKAGVPYLIKPTKDITEPVRVSGVFTNENIGGMSIRPENSVATFHGITSPTTLEIDENPNTLFLFLVADNRLATATANGPMLGNRAYFTLDKKQDLPKRSMISIVKSTPTGFEEIYNTYQTEAYKMLYNGMIVIVRDGVMYDLMGTRIK